MSKDEEFCLHCEIIKVIEANMDRMINEYGDRTGPYIMTKLAEVVTRTIFASVDHEVDAMLCFMNALNEQMNADSDSCFEMIALDQRDPQDKEAIEKMDEVHEMVKSKVRGTIQ